MRLNWVCSIYTLFHDMQTDKEFSLFLCTTVFDAGAQSDVHREQNVH